MSADREIIADAAVVTEADAKALLLQRWRERVARVQAAMREERVNWVPQVFVTPDGRIAANVVAVEMTEESNA